MGSMGVLKTYGPQVPDDLAMPLEGTLSAVLPRVSSFLPSPFQQAEWMAAPSLGEDFRLEQQFPNSVPTAHSGTLENSQGCHRLSWWPLHPCCLG